MNQLSGRIHNAKRITRENKDYFIAAVHKDGKLSNDPSVYDNVGSFDTYREAAEWLRKRLCLLGVPDAPIVRGPDS